MAPASKKTQKEKSKVATKINNGSKKPFKSDRKPKKDARSEALSLQIDDEIPDFPRGGGSSLSRQERDEIRAEVDAEYDVDERQLKKNKRKKTQIKSHGEIEDLGSLFGGGITGKLPRYSNKITIKNISPGMKLWGVVTEVNQKDLVISLPGGLRGLVHASEAMNILSDDGTEGNESGVFGATFSLGQLVSCVVLHLDDDKKESGKRKIWLSLRLSLLHKGYNLDAVQEGMVLTGYVKSIEDHGYILHFGVPLFSGFLAKGAEDENKEFNVRVGKLIQGIVKSVDRTRKVVYLRDHSDTVSKCVTKDLKGISMDLLIPGMMVNARVQSVLENGIMLTFLTYFTGTVDVFHLLDPFSGQNWKDDYSQNKQVNARILFIDPSTRAIGLTLNPHLVCNRVPPLPVTTGGIFDQSKVVRIDRGSGLLLELPSSPPTPAYVHVSEAAEDGSRKLDKKFREGSSVRVRILGINNFDGLAIGTLKASALEGPIFIHSDVKPGMVVKAKVISVDSFGAIVQFSGGLKALCPLTHMSEFEIVKPGKKFKVGGEATFRVLGCKSKRITVTHKKTLVKSKLPLITSFADATDGLVTHGWITKIEKHGCLVRFYNGVQGFAPRHELGLEPGTDPESVHHVGEVVKCRVVSAVHASRRIKLSFVINPRRVSEDDTIKLGSLVSGTVKRFTRDAVVVSVKGKSYVEGTIPTEHLADHHELASLMRSLLEAKHETEYEFDQLVVLDKTESNNWLLSSKPSLIRMTEDLPSDISQIHPNSVLHGYICNLIEVGCFVRFLGRLTGFSPKSKAMDEQNASLSKVFYVGQSVLCNITDVNKVEGKVTLSLKQSSCTSMDAPFIQGYFLMDEKIAALQARAAIGNEFSIGEVVEGTVKESKDLGLTVKFGSNRSILGYIPENQLVGTVLEPGSLVQAVILDVSRRDGLIDLSLKPEFIRGSAKETSSKGEKKRKRASKDLEMHEKVNAVVEIVKENYVVLSIPEYNYAIGYASLHDYNTQMLPQKHFSNGQSVVTSVVALPSPSSLGRLLLLLDSVTEAGETSQSKRAKKKSSFKIGSVVQAEITEIKPLEMRVNFGVGFRGRIHITEVNDENTSEEPFLSYKIGQTVTAQIVAKLNQNFGQSPIWELKPEMVTGSTDLPNRQLNEQAKYKAGQLVKGYVYKVDSKWVWLAITRNVKAQLFILDSTSEPSELQEFQKRFHLGKAVSGYVLSFNKEKKTLRLVQRPVLNASKREIDGLDNKTDPSERNVYSEDFTVYTHEGDILGGRIAKILPGVGGMLVEIGPRVHGRVPFTELKDLWISDPLSGYREGQFVKCKVLEISHSVTGAIQVDLSLRSLLDGMVSHDQSELHNDVGGDSKRFERIEDLSPGMVVKGYVKNTMSKGCFIMLSRKVEAKILLSNLSDGFVDDPEKEFPVGKLVNGRVLTVEPLSKRVEVTLKSVDGDTSKSQANDLNDLNVGEISCGRIKRIEPYGLFITIGNTNMVGLCHVSEVSDEKIDSVEGKYKAGERVTVKILKVDQERRRISLGMKDSYFVDEKESVRDLIQSTSESAMDHDPSDTIMRVAERNEHTLDETYTEKINRVSAVLAHVESRASVPPLEINLDDIENSDNDNTEAENRLVQGGTDSTNEKTKKRANKKAKEERERDIRAAEERLLEKDVPRTADEFEKLVRSSPDNSFVWIKYMAFMLSLADVEKARSIAERALRTINMREENEKLNIWVAYFNLENEHGNPPEESVTKVFQRALQVCDPKKVYLALLGVYERTEQHRLADELLDKMIKKFKHSRKVWLRRVQRLLQQNEDDVQPIINRALLSLRRDKHIKFLSQAAILEFKCGVPDRARSLFEGILREYPKRTDLWSIYLDQEIRLGDVDVTRSLFERAITLSLPPKKMKFLFKKYLEFEKSIGDEERVEYVKQKAMEYVESTMA